MSLPPVLVHHARGECMLIACWSPKGGSGTTVTAAVLALVLARSSVSEALLVDLAGDVPAVLGIAEPAGPGLVQWLTAEGDVDEGALRRLEVEVTPSLGMLPTGLGAEAFSEHVLAGPQPGRAEALLAAFATGQRLVVADCGTLSAAPLPEAATALAAGADLSLLVLRPCYLAVRRALAAPLRPSAVVLLKEPGRAMGRAELEEVLGVPVRVEIDVDPLVARAVDAGLLTGRLPKRLERALRAAA